METLQNGFCLDTPPGTFPLSTDSMLLSGFVKLPKNAKVLDLGSGCATLGLLLCAGDAACRVTGIEIDQAAHNAAIQNIDRNNLSDRLVSVCADLRTVATLFSPGSFDVCVSNPPYFSGGPASIATPLARRDDFCSANELFEAASRALRYGGDFFLVHKPEKLAELCACAVNAGLEPKRLQLVRHKADKEVSLILLSCRKGGKSGLIWEEMCLMNADGTPTDAYRKLYHI